MCMQTVLKLELDGQKWLPVQKYFAIPFFVPIPLNDDELWETTFYPAVPWLLEMQPVYGLAPGPTNIHLDSTNIQSLNTTPLDISWRRERKKKAREMYLCWYPLVSGIRFIKTTCAHEDGFVCVGVWVCVCLCVYVCLCSCVCVGSCVFACVCVCVCVCV